MTFIPIAFDDVQEPKPVPAGSYELQITKAEATVSGERSNNPGSPLLKVNLGIVEHPEAPNVQHYISLPAEGDDPNKAAFKALMLKRFLTLFKVPFESNGIDTEQVAMQMVGATATADLTLGEPNDNGDVYNQLKVPKMRGESSTGQGRASPPRR